MCASFSYSINNPNNFIINQNDYNVVPFGYRCPAAIVCKIANIRKFSLPFDWAIPLFPSKIKKVLENNFDDFIPDVYNDIFINKYGIFISHFNSNLNSGIQEYIRRIGRFNTIINEPKKVYFIYINEDYLFDNYFRTDEFNNIHFIEMLEFENFIKNKYVNIDYNILYFNFKEHVIPTNSNIINIVLHTNILYNTHDEAPVDDFRIYCGKILTELFNTKLNLNFRSQLFNTHW